MAKSVKKNVTVDSNSNKEVKNMSTKTTNNVLSTEGTIILYNLMAEAKGDKTYKVLFKSKKYPGVLLAKKSNLLAFAKRTLPKLSEQELKTALNELFKAGALFYRNLDRGCLMGMRQQEWSRAKELLLAAFKDTPEPELSDKNITFEGDTPIGGNGVEPRELK